MVVDAGWETADVNVHNNHYPRRIIPSRIEAYKKKKRKGLAHKDLMHESKEKIKEPKKKQHKK